jgi:anti-sigma B factor antagonist
MEDLQITVKGKSIVFTCTGELTLEICPDLKRRIEEILEQEEVSCVLADLGRTTFLDSSGIGFLVALRNRLSHEGKRFFLLRPSEQVRKTLLLVQLLKYFDVLLSEHELDARFC